MYWGVAYLLIGPDFHILVGPMLVEAVVCVVNQISVSDADKTDKEGSAGISIG